MVTLWQVIDILTSGMSIESVSPFARIWREARGVRSIMRIVQGHVWKQLKHGDSVLRSWFLKVVQLVLGVSSPWLLAV